MLDCYLGQHNRIINHQIAMHMPTVKKHGVSKGATADDGIVRVQRTGLTLSL